MAATTAPVGECIGVTSQKNRRSREERIAGGKEKRKREGRTNPKDGITRDALGTTRKRPLVGDAGEETKRKNGRKRLVVAADESAAASGGSTWVKKPTTTTTTTREDANAEDAHLTAKERFLKNSREHRKMC